MKERPYLIGITGGSGSGKTSIIHELRALFSDDQLCIISQDEYYHPREKQVWDDAGYQNFDLPESIDHKAFASDIQKVMSGETVVKSQYTFNNPNKISASLTFKPAPVIIVEGLFVFYFDEIRELMDLKFYIDAEDIIKLKRRIIRDSRERNYPIEDVLHRYEHHVLPSYRNYIEPFKRQADLVINNHVDYAKSIEVIGAVISVKNSVSNFP